MIKLLLVELHTLDLLRNFAIFTLYSGVINKAKLAVEEAFILFRDHLVFTKTRLLILTPLKPNFYIVKLGFTWVFIIFLILLRK